MPLRIDRVDTEIEILRQASDTPERANTVDSGTGGASAGADELLSPRQARAELRERLRPIVMEILNDELDRIKRKVGAP